MLTAFWTTLLRRVRFLKFLWFSCWHFNNIQFEEKKMFLHQLCRLLQTDDCREEVAPRRIHFWRRRLVLCSCHLVECESDPHVSVWDDPLLTDFQRLAWQKSIFTIESSLFLIYSLECVAAKPMQSDFLLLKFEKTQNPVVDTITWMTNWPRPVFMYEILDISYTCNHLKMKLL